MTKEQREREADAALLGCDWYMLDSKGNPVPAESLEEWALSMGDGEQRQVARDTVGDVVISTVFLGIDQSPLGGSTRRAPPVLWETMTFSESHEDLDQWQERYRSREEALQGHAKIVALVMIALEGKTTE